MLYCFELTKELVVQDHWSVGEPISSLTWSASYDKLAFCTPQVNTVTYYKRQFPAIILIYTHMYCTCRCIAFIYCVY